MVQHETGNILLVTGKLVSLFSCLFPSVHYLLHLLGHNCLHWWLMLVLVTVPAVVWHAFGMPICMNFLSSRVTGTNLGRPFLLVKSMLSVPP